MKLSRIAVKNPQTITLFTIFILIISVMGVNLITVELNPEIIAPVFSISITYTGASPNEIENEIVKKVEEKLKGVNGIKKVQSYCINSLANIIVTFNDNINIATAKNDVRNAVNEATPDMPRGIETPVINSMDYSDEPILTIILKGKTKNLVKLREIAEQIQAPLGNINGVKKVKIIGGYKKEIHINLNPVKMIATKISVNYLVNLLSKSNLNYPGGNLSIMRNEYPMRIVGRFQNINQLKNTIIAAKRNANNPYAPVKIIKLKDIARVEFGVEENNVITRYNGKNCIGLQVIKKKKTSTINVAKRVKRAIFSFQKTILNQNGLKFLYLLDHSEHVTNNLNELQSNMIQGIIVIFIILWLGMGIRNALIAAVGLPFCVIITIGALYFSGNTLNSVTQFGLIMVMGMIVDGAIVVLECIYRHREEGKSKEAASINGIEEVGTSVLSSVLTTMAAFAPMLFMTGMLGKFMSAIPNTVLIALFASILFDHLVIPVIAKKFIGKPKTKKLKKKNNNIIFKFYGKFIKWAILNRVKTAFISLLMFIIGVYIFTSRPGELFPKVDGGQVFINIELPPISSIQLTDEIVKRIEKEILNKYVKSKIIKSYLSVIGEGNTNSVAVSAKATAKISIEMVKHKFRKNFSSEKFRNILRKYVKNIPGAKINVQVDGFGVNVGEAINIVVFGENSKILRRISKRIQSIIRKNVSGAINIRDNYGKGIPTIEAKILRRNAELYGISIGDIAASLSSLYNGLEVTKHFYSNKEIKVKIKVDKKFASSITDLNRMSFLNETNNRVIPLSEVVRFKFRSGYSIITREDMQRAITIIGGVSKHTSVEVIQNIMQELRGFPLPDGYKIMYRGENEERDEGMKSLGFAFIGGLILMYIIIVLQLKSFIQPLAILITLILSIVGVAFGLLLSGSKVGFMSMFGIVSLAGIVVNDAIVLVTYINSLREKGIKRIDALISASLTRIRPILLTTFTTIGGLVPLAFALGGPLTVHWVPMAWAIIGGLLFATFQTLVVVPVVYSLLDDLTKYVKAKVLKIISLVNKIFQRKDKIDLNSIENFTIKYETKDENNNAVSKDIVYKEI